MNKKNILVSFLAIIMIIFGLSSCATNKGIDYAHNSKNSLDWAGVYTGTIPSASGSGINVRLRLNSDLSYALSYDYLEKPNSRFDCTGSFKWDSKGSTVILDVKDMPAYYKVGENMLIQLDMKGKEIKGILADDYVLKKER